ncbi:hypothetical protein L1987_77938 [Smallanthus sonchifolius]|uniref:Uncharacterized protein n=1 Tax=Smallanthus sonchifolius TaxID=185202 RepID=A0ACB8ZCB0_9ASTR|nr:hypothetical protein L1987_77938 [Smallanthus sonchifolius]
MFNALTKKEVASWNTLLMGYGMCGVSDSALSLFESMKYERKVCGSLRLIVVQEIVVKMMLKGASQCAEHINQFLLMFC